MWILWPRNSSVPLPAPPACMYYSEARIHVHKMLYKDIHQSIVHRRTNWEKFKGLRSIRSGLAMQNLKENVDSCVQRMNPRIYYWVTKQSYRTICLIGYHLVKQPHTKQYYLQVRVYFKSNKKIWDTTELKIIATVIRVVIILSAFY